MPPATPQTPADDVKTGAAPAAGHVEHPPVSAAARAAAPPHAPRAALPTVAPAFARTARPTTGSVTTAIPGELMGAPMPRYAAPAKPNYGDAPYGTTAVAATVPFARPAAPQAPARPARPAFPPAPAARHDGPATIPARDRFAAPAGRPGPAVASQPHTDGFAPVAGSIGPARDVPSPVLSPEDAAANRVLDTLMKLGHRVRGVLDSRFSPMKMTDARYMALRVVQDSAPEGCTQAKLAAALGQCESSVSTLVERMRTGKLVYRLHPKSDRRKRVLLLTDQGREALEHAEAARAEAARELCVNLSADDRHGLCDMLGVLLAGVQQTDADAGRRRKVA